MKSNFDEYYYIMQARKSKNFKALDDKVRTLTIDIGKGKGDKKEYTALLAERNKMLQAYIDSVKVPEIEFSKETDFKTVKLLSMYIEKFPKVKLPHIIMLGTAGTGKTYCAKILEQKIKLKGKSVYFTTTFNLVKRMKDHLYGRDYNAIDDLIESDLLIIDDLGAEPTINNGDEFLYTVINERYSNDKHFIITTNLTEDQILTRYDQRIFGRIFDKNKSAAIVLEGKDFRIG